MIKNLLYLNLLIGDSISYPYEHISCLQEMPFKKAHQFSVSSGFRSITVKLRLSNDEQLRAGRIDCSGLNLIMQTLKLIPSMTSCRTHYKSYPVCDPSLSENYIRRFKNCRTSYENSWIRSFETGGEPSISV